ncbi:MAG TPA: NAD(P)H-hydrate dehydratase [Candidatus Angelobacter sp.]|nr:NAD(P)H-hydrate dehydratase [Candidatus Angelobacter sp.]
MRVLASYEVSRIEAEAASRADTPASLLVQRAGYAVAQFCLAHFKFRSVCVVCGVGDHGSYGIAAAQVLSTIAEQVSVIVLARDVSALSAEAAAICDSLAAEPMWVSAEAGFQDEAIQQALEAELIIDAVAGSGFKSPLEGTDRKAVEAINQASGIVVSVGVPSGVEADSNVPVHEGGSEAVYSHGVITFVAPAAAHVFARLTAGPIAVSELGVQPSLVSNEKSLSVVTAQEVRITFPPRPDEAHKGDFGRVLVIGGALHQAGSAALAGIAALRIGAGLVTIASPRSSQPTIAGFAPELMTEGLNEDAAGRISLAARDKIVELWAKADVVVLGPDRPRDDDETAEFMRWLIGNCPAPLVLQDVGLPDTSENRAEKSGDQRLRVIVLDVEKAAAFLQMQIKEVEADRIDAARRVAREIDACIVLKGLGTVVAGRSGETWISMTGNSALAKNGCDDALCGMIAAALVRHPADRSALLRELDVASAVYLHGLAGDLARDIFHENTLLATDLLESLSDAFRDCELQSDRGLFYLRK